MLRHHTVYFLISALMFAISAPAQTSTGTISGTVVDTTGQVIPDAQVKLTSERTGDLRDTTTNGTGDFVFPALVPGPYSIAVQAKGFRQFKSQGNNLLPSARLEVGALQLEIGSLTESITVQAAGATVQTGNSENGSVLSTRQMETMAVRGRDPVSMLRILPGVTQGYDPEFNGGFYGTNMPSFQGLSTNSTTIMSDGVNGGDGGAGGVFSATVNMDAISEVKVQMSNYTAEYGRSGGAQINIITKGGGKDLHGTGYWYKRHEMFNANSFFRNLNGVPKQLYRFQNLGGTVGGPVKLPIPIINRGGDKMFFFYSYDNNQIKEPVNLERWTMPTLLERQGNFSQSNDLNGRQITVRDPTNGNIPFPNNIIPSNRANPFGVAIMNIFPTPNFNGVGYNYLFQEESLGRPRNQHLFRFDLHPTDSDTISVKGSMWHADTIGYHIAGGSSPWGLVRQHYEFTGDQLTLNYTKIITPRLVNELFVGFFIDTEDGRTPNDQETQRLQRQNRGLGGLSQFVPQSNPINVIPKATFGGIPASFSAASISYDNRFPLFGADSNLTTTETVTYSRGAHSFKFGGYRENSRFGQARSSTFAGQFDFGQDVNDPLSTGYAFSNAYTGHFAKYTEGLGRPAQFARKNTWAVFAQDTWKIRKNLTMDIGVRVYWSPWALQSNPEASAFSFERYDPKKTPTLFRPVATADGRRALNPLTGEILPQTYIGAIVPGTGDSCTSAITPNSPCKLNGVVVQNDPAFVKGYGGFRDALPLQYDPRLGFAWDPFGNAKTAVRASFGVFHQASIGGNAAYDGGPAFRFDKSIVFSDMNQFLNAGSITTPIGVTGPYRQQKLPLVYQYMLGVQREIIKGTVLDVAYVGNNSHHNQQSYNYNQFPYGTRFRPENADPANPAQPLPDVFLRRYIGYQDISIAGPATTTRYDSLQVQLNRRFIGKVELSGAYTYAKAFVNGWAQELPSRLRRTLLPNDQTQVFNLSYVVDLPKGSNLVPGRPAKWVLDNWQLSGITTFASGFPQNVSLQTTDNFDFTGGGDGGGVVQTGRAQLSHGEKSFYRWFDTSVFKRPSGRGDIGTDFSNVKFRGPGFVNYDLSMFKNFPIAGERRKLQFRWEFYNLFNHTQYGGVNSTARFDPQGNQVNAAFGQVNSARNERRMQGSLRFLF